MSDRPCPQEVIHPGRIRSGSHSVLRRGPVNQCQATRRESGRFDEIKLSWLLEIGEQRCSTADGEWVHNQPVFVDQTQTRQRLHELGTAMGNDVAAGLNFEVGDLLRGVSTCDRRLRSVCSLQRLANR